MVSQWFRPSFLKYTMCIGTHSNLLHCLKHFRDPCRCVTLIVVLSFSHIFKFFRIPLLLTLLWILEYLCVLELTSLYQMHNKDASKKDLLKFCVVLVNSSGQIRTGKLCSWNHKILIVWQILWAKSKPHGNCMCINFRSI